jgi:glutamate racemase
VSAEAPIGILAEDGHGIAVARAVQRALPKEDVLLLCDDAYAPYARRRPELVVRRVGEQLAALRSDGAKLLVLASPQGAIDAPSPPSVLGPIALEAPVAQAGAACGGGAVAVVVAAGTVRGRTFGQALRRQRGARAVCVEEWPLVAGAAAERIPALAAAGIAALALTSPGLAALRPEIEEAAGTALAVVDACDVVAARVARTLRHAGLVARRPRAGRVVVVSTDPRRAARTLSEGAAAARTAATPA